MNNSMLKKRYDPIIGRYVKKDIYTEETYGEGLMDIFKSVGSKIFNKTAKDIAKKGAKSAVNKATTKVGEHIGSKAGDKIVQLLQKKQPMQAIKSNNSNQPLTEFEIAQRVNRLISGGKAMKM